VQPKHLSSLDFLRVLAILAVVLIHTSIKVVQNGGQGIFLHQISGFAVPLFFILSGHVLELNYSGNWFGFYTKRLPKLILPLFFWSLIYFYLIYPGGSNFWTSFITGSASYHLYFVPTLAIFYLSFPALHATYSFWSKKPILFLLFVFQFLLLATDYYSHVQILLPLRIVILGWFSFIFGIVARPRWLVFVILAFAGFIYYEGLTGPDYYSQWRPSVLIYSLLIFWQFINSNWHSKIISQLSQASYFVFFIHVLIIEKLNPFFGRSNLNLFVSVVLSSFALAFIAQRIPKLSKLTG
jgi:surface polysaccharide O-acyltransferase-like enzyme